MRRSIFALLVSIAAGCNGAGGSAATSTNAVELALVGVANVQLFDATTGHNDSSDVVSAVVTINEIDAKVDGPNGKDVWIPIATTPVTVDLLKLDNTTLNTLGITTLPAGHSEELRLVLDQIGDYVVLKDGTKKPLEVPDNGIVEVEGKLDLDACASGIIILDFDPRIKTEHEEGRHEYELSCHSHIKTEELKGSCTPPPPPQCSATVPCPTGDVCQAGACVPDPCAGVMCATGQVCLGAPPCVPDPCFTVVCTVGKCDPHDGMCH